MRQRQNLFVFTLCSEWVRKLTFGLAETMGLVGLVRYYLLEILFACFSFTARSFLLTFLVSRALLDRKVKYFVSEMDKFISGVKGGAVIEGWHEHWRRIESASESVPIVLLIGSQESTWHVWERGQWFINIPVHLWHDPQTLPEWNDDNREGKWAMKFQTHRGVAKNNTTLVGKWSKQSRWNKFELNYKQILDFFFVLRQVEWRLLARRKKKKAGSALWCNNKGIQTRHEWIYRRANRSPNCANLQNHSKNIN